MLFFFHRRSHPGLIATACAAMGLVGLASAADVDCAAAAQQVRRLVAAKPERVLLIVEDSLVVSDACACEVVKAALKASAASAKLTGQIVLVAVSAAPAKQAQIAECAKAAHPDAAGEIEAAVRKALGTEARPKKPGATVTAAAVDPIGQSAGEKEPASQPPKNPPPPAPVEEADFGLSPVAIGGVYLVYPGSGSSPQLVRGKDGSLSFVGPGGRLIPLDPPPARLSQRPARPPSIIIVHPPTATASDSSPAEQPATDPLPTGGGVPPAP